VGTTAAPGLFFQHRIDRFPHALKNSPSKPPRSGILALGFQLGHELDQQSFCSGCHEFRQAVEVDLVGREPIQAGVRPGGVVELQVFSDGSPGFLDRLLCMEIDLFIFDRLPDSLHEKIISPTALAVHADVNAVLS
jgi:hypothetical protein